MIWSTTMRSARRFTRVCIVVENLRHTTPTGREQEAVETVQGQPRTTGAASPRWEPDRMTAIPGVGPQLRQKGRSGNGSARKFWSSRGYLPFGYADAPRTAPPSPTATGRGCSSHAATPGPPQRPRSRCWALGYTVPDGSKRSSRGLAGHAVGAPGQHSKQRRYHMTEPIPRPAPPEPTPLGGGRSEPQRRRVRHAGPGRRCEAAPRKPEPPHQAARTRGEVGARRHGKPSTTGGCRGGGGAAGFDRAVRFHARTPRPDAVPR